MDAPEPQMLEVVDSEGVITEISISGAVETPGHVHLTINGRQLLAKASDLELGIGKATHRLARAPWPVHVADPSNEETSPFDVVCTAIPRSEPVEISTRESNDRMLQRQRANRAIEADQPVFDLQVSAAIPAITATNVEIVGVPGAELTVTSLYWTAHLLRALSESAEKLMRSSSPKSSSGLLLP